MKSILRSTLILSSSSAVSIVVGLVSAKAWAVLLGPGGLGYMGLLQTLVALANLVVGLGVASALLRMAPNALAREDYEEVAALQAAAWLLFYVLGGLALVVLIIFRVPISRVMLDGPEHALSVVLMGVALLFTLASGVQTTILNAYHRVGVLASIGLLTTLCSTAASLILVWRWREQSIPLAIITSAIVSWLISSYFSRRERDPRLASPSREKLLQATWALLRFSGPYTASMLVGTGVQLALPVLVLHELGTASVGFYRAAVAVSVSYLGFLLAAMSQDYYPRVSAASHRPAALVELVNQQHRLIMLLAVPMILGALALAPYLVPLIYSGEFMPAVTVLEWYLIGDLFKFSSWTVGYVIVARKGSMTLFLVELVAGSIILAASWFGMQRWGLAGLGVAFMLTYIVHYFLVYLIVQRDIGLTWTRENKGMMLAACVAALIIRVLPAVGLDSFRTPVALGLALLAGSGAVYMLWQDIGGLQNVRLWHKRIRNA